MLNVEVSKPKDGEVVLKGEIPVDTTERYFKRIIEEMRRDFELPGFRRGKVPEKLFQSHVQELKALEEAAERAINDLYPDIVKEQGIEPYGPPHAAFTKLARGNPVGFTLRIPIKPEIKLPDYKKIAKKTIAANPIENTEATDSELETIIDQVRGMRARQGTNPAEPPELTDEFVRALGAFENVEDFKSKMRENIKREKELDARSRRRETIARELVKAASISLSPLVVLAETTAALEHLTEDLKRLRVSMEDHLKHIGKTEEEFIKGQRDYIERQIKTKLIFDAIAEAENLAVDEQEVSSHATRLAERHPGADPETLTRYARRLLMNEKVMELLEKA